MPNAPQPQKTSRRFGVIRVEPTLQLGDNVAPLTPGQKFKVAAWNSFDVSSFVVTGIVAGISYGGDEYPGFGRGAEGFGRYYGAAFGDQAIGQFMTQAVLPSAFHQDPRYFRMGSGGFGKRFFYSVSREWVARNDDGTHSFNTSELAGNLATAGISNAYYPDEERTAGRTFERWGIRLGSDAGFNLIEEFWPDVRRKIGKHK